LHAIHRLPKYLALYTGADGFHPTYNGKIAYMDLMLGEQAFYKRNYDTIPSFMNGIMEFTPKNQIVYE
jgi:hypothetical protein